MVYGPCPWAHRTLIYRALKGLEDMISVSVLHWRMKQNGWAFEDGPGVIADPVLNADCLHELYTEAMPDHSGRVTVPLLWDKSSGQIVSNESADIIRMLNSAFDTAGARSGDYYPEPHRVEIDELNSLIYDNVNNGVYKAGFASSQSAYESAVAALFQTLDTLESRLESRPIYVETQSPKQICDCCRVCCASIWSMLVISSVMSDVLLTTQIFIAT